MYTHAGEFGVCAEYKSSVNTLGKLNCRWRVRRFSWPINFEARQLTGKGGTRRYLASVLSDGVKEHSSIMPFLPDTYIDLKPVSAGPAF